LIGDENTPPKPIRDITDIETELDERVLAGFGGVSEYGITVRWDKNFLTMIHLTLQRRDKFRMFGGVRFGGTMTIEDAWKRGFDHIAIATGAGKPTVIDMKNNLIRGIRKASDFLMALQLTGAFKRSAMANLQVQLPAVVIGGGLTAIDTATELLAYYPVQVEKMLERFETLSVGHCEDHIWKMYDEEERRIMQTFIEHGRAVRAEREIARLEDREPDFIKLVRRWGGVSLVYRKGMVDSPAYRLNHEEIIKSLEEGIYFVEHLSPVEAEPDEFGAVAALRFERMKQDEKGKWNLCGEFITFPQRLSALRPAPVLISFTKRNNLGRSSWTNGMNSLPGTRLSQTPMVSCKSRPPNRAMLHSLHRTKKMDGSFHIMVTIIRSTPVMSSRRWQARNSAIRML